MQDAVALMVDNLVGQDHVQTFYIIDGMKLHN